ncbi:hypothetical protein OFC08_30505, partial [Escherichia coli]|nr:hypothetical protein [Escherichia coli]
SIYRSKAERIRFLMNILSLPVHIWVLFSDKSFWWYKKVIASNGEDFREATVPDTACTTTTLSAIHMIVF